MTFGKSGLFVEIDTIDNLAYRFEGTCHVRTDTVFLALEEPDQKTLVLEQTRIRDGVLIYEQSRADGTSQVTHLTRCQ